MEIHEGQIIDGLFKITKKDFSKGGHGEIHLAQDALGRKIALKFPRFGNPAKNLGSFKREYQSLLKFAHPNVGKVYRFGEHEGHFFIASEFIEGKLFHLGLVGLTPEQMVPLYIQALEGLEAIHTEGMLHADIKPGNILLTPEWKAKIIDFGVAITMKELKPDYFAGTAHYIAPEMVLKRGADNRADLFSFGCLMYKCVAAGNYPFPKRSEVRMDRKKLEELVEREGEPLPPSHFGRVVPGYLDEIILKLLAKNPSERFGSARAVINALKTHHPEDYKETPEAKGSYLIPQGNRHIGREKEQGLLFKSVEKLLVGQQPANAIFWIYGAEGMGKSHLLGKIKEAGEREAEKVFIHFLQLPRDFKEQANGEQEWLEEWITLLDKHLADNTKPLLVLVDNVGAVFKGSSPLEGKLKNVLMGMIESIQKRTKEVELFVGSMPVMLCLTSRSKPGLHESQVEIELKPFTVEETRAYLKATPALRHKEIPLDWVKSLFSQSNGSPKELKEILLEKDSKGVLFDLNGEMLMAQVEDSSIHVVDEEEVPKTSRQRLSGVLADLSEPERECLEWMAVWCSGGLLHSILYADLDSLIHKNHFLPILNQLVSKGLLLHDVSEDHYSFGKYSYLPSWTYQNLEEEARKTKHQAIYEHLLKIYSNQKGDQDAILFHLALGSFNKEAIRACLSLGKKFLYDRGKASFVKTLYERALERFASMNPKLNAFLSAKSIESSYYAGAYEEALKIFQKAKEIIQHNKPFPKNLEALLSIAVIPVFIETLKLNEANQMIEESLKTLGRSSSYLCCILLNFKARLLYKKFYSEKGGVNKFLEEAKSIYEESERQERSLSPIQRGLIRNNDLGIVLQTLGDHRAAAKKLYAKLERLKRNPNVFIEFVTSITLAEANRYLKNYDDAFHFAEKSLKMAQETRQGKWIQYAHQVMASIHQAKGSSLLLRKKGKAKKEFELALKENSCSLAASACLENRQDAESGNIAIFIRKGQCYQELNEWDLAIAHFEAVLHYKPTSIYLSLAYLGLGEGYTQKGDGSRARDYLKKSLECLKGLPRYLADHSEFNICKAQAQCCLKEGNTAEAEKYISRMKALARDDQELLEQFQFFQKSHGEISAGH